MKQRLKSWLTKPSAMGRATMILMVTMALSNILGLVRNIILSKNIPLDRLDAYYAAFNIPDLLFNLLILGAISTALIPVFSEVINKKDNETAWRVVNNFLNSSILVLLVFLVLALIFMDPMIHLLSPGFNVEKHDLTVKLARIMLLSPFLFSISYIIGGVLNTYKNFLAYATAPLLYNIAIIIGAFISPYYKGVETVSYFVVLGAAVHLFVQIPAAISIGWKHQFVLDFKDVYLRKIVHLMIPRSIGLGIGQINFIAFTVIGSTMNSGTIAIYKLTNDLQTTPTVVFASSLAIAAFPFMTEKATQNNREAVTIIAFKCIRMILFFLIPCTIIGIILSPKIIPLYLALGHDMVNRAETNRAIYTFILLIISISTQGLIGIYARVYYAYQDTKLPMIFSFLGTALSITLAIIFNNMKLDVAGLALAFSLGSWFNFALLWYWSGKYLKLNKKLGNSFGVLRIIFSAIMSGFGTLFALKFSENYITSARVNGLIVQCLIALTIGAIIYWYILYILKAEELRWIKNKKKTFIEN